jgi:hypothetical protein
MVIRWPVIRQGIVYKFNIRTGVCRTIFRDWQLITTAKFGIQFKRTGKNKCNDLSFTTYSFQYGVDEPDFFHFLLPSGEIIFGVVTTSLLPTRLN